jgi:hypothetical protein
VERTPQHADFQPRSSCKLRRAHCKASLGGFSHQLHLLVVPFLYSRLSTYSVNGKTVNLHPLPSSIRKQHANKNTCLGWNYVLHYILLSWNHLYFRNLCSSNRRKSACIANVEEVRPEHGDQLHDISSQRYLRHLSGCHPDSRGDESTHSNGEENKDLFPLHAGSVVSFPLLMPARIDTTS